MPCGVGLDLRVRSRLAAAALVEQSHIIERRIEQATMVGRNRAARSAMQEDGRLGAWRADLFPIDHVTVADIEVARCIGFDFRVERTQYSRHFQSFVSGQCTVS
ncbi:hypothetical protein D9M72_601710 [compost metagenome]